MKNNEDIGKFFKEQLNEVKKTPKEELWERINNSLDQKRKKRRFLYFWLTGFGVAMVILLFSINSSQSNTKTENSFKSSSEKNNKVISMPKNETDTKQIDTSKIIKNSSGKINLKNLEDNSFSKKNKERKKYSQKNGLKYNYYNNLLLYQ